MRKRFKDIRLCICLDEPLMDELQAAADFYQSSKGGLIRLALSQWLEAKRPEYRPKPSVRDHISQQLRQRWYSHPDNPNIKLEKTWDEPARKPSFDMMQKEYPDYANTLEFIDLYESVI